MLHSVLAAGLALLVAATPLAAAPATAAADGPATAMMSRQWDFVSTVNGRSYRVQVALPVGPPPSAGYPVLYVTDGGGFFGAFTDLLRVRGLGGEVAPAVIVGITYPADNFGVQFTRRYLDLTPSDADAEQKAMDAAQKTGNEYAGADAFLKIIESEIKPRVATLAKVDPARAILYGHSLGGLFALHVLLTHPAAFQTYLISSPSIWWHGRDVLKDEAGFAAQVVAGKVAARAFIVVGQNEEVVPPPPYPPGITREFIEQRTLGAAMVTNASALAARLAALQGAPGYRVEAKVFAGESHLSVPFASFNALAAFALPPAPRP